MGIELNRREVRKRESGRADEQLSYSRQLLDRGVWPKIVVIAAVFCILVAPSAWMLATISPLWKDVDAYGQVTAPPGEATILLYGPAYCFLARLPLYIGYLYDCWRAGTVHPAFTAFFAQPALSDSGVFLLLLVQHLALCAGASLLILAATRCVIARLALALLWAANPVFYVWANCVGTEALSMILLLLIATVGLRIVQRPSYVPVRLWVFLGLLFSLSMLTRHINGLLGALLPLTFSFAAMARFVLARGQHSSRKRRGGRDLHRIIAAVLVGITSIAVSSVAVRALSHISDINYHSTVGFTFMFRLSFFASLSPAERDEVVRHAAAEDQSRDMRSLLEVYRTAPWGSSKLDIMTILAKARSVLPRAALEDEKFPELLNQTARVFLTSPSAPFLRAVRADFAKSQASTLANVIGSPFNHTRFYFSHARSMPRCANLMTFRARNPAMILAQLNTRYLRGWRKFSFRALIVGWAALALLVAYLSRSRGLPVLSYAAGLTIVGLLMMLANCLLNEYQARYTLPMWELLILSATILVGSTTQFFRGASRATDAGQERAL